MRVLFTILFATCLCLSEAKRLKFDLFYESLCPDSIRFIKDEVTETYEALGNDLDIRFVPYGFATVGYF